MSLAKTSPLVLESTTAAKKTAQGADMLRKRYGADQIEE